MIEGVHTQPTYAHIMPGFNQCPSLKYTHTLHRLKYNLKTTLKYKINLTNLPSLDTRWEKFQHDYLKKRGSSTTQPRRPIIQNGRLLELLIPSNVCNSSLFLLNAKAISFTHQRLTNITYDWSTMTEDFTTTGQSMNTRPQYKTTDWSTFNHICI